MAEGFTTTLPQPSDRVDGSVKMGHGEMYSAIGGALSGLADIGDKALDKYDQYKEQGVLADTSQKLYEQEQAYTSGPSTPPDLIGQADPNGEAAQSSPAYQNAVGEINKLKQGNSQGRIGQDEYWAKSSAIVQRAIMENPRYAGDIRKAAQDLLGVSPTQQMLSVKLQDEDTLKKRTEAVTNSQVDAASKAGIAYYLPDGSGQLDVGRTARAGADLMQSESKIKTLDQQLDIELKQAQIAKAGQGTPLTLEDQKDMETRAFLAQSNPVYGNMVEAAVSRLPAEAAKLVGQTDTQKSAWIQQQIGQLKAGYKVWLNGQMNRMKTPLSASSSAAINTYYDNQFKAYEDLATGPLSDFQTNTRMLTQMKTQSGIELHQSAPLLSKINDVFGPAAAPFVSTALTRGTGNIDQINNEVAGFTGQGQGALPPPTAQDNLHNGTAVAAGQIKVSNLPTADHQRGVLQPLMATYKDLTSRPNTLQPKELNVFGNIAGNVLEMGLAKDATGDDVKNAAGYTNTAAAMRTLDRYAEIQPDKGKLLAQGVTSVQAVDIQNQVADLKPILNNTIASGRFGAGTKGSQAYWRAGYNPATGMVEIAGDPNSLGRPPSSMTEAVNQINANLNSMNHLKKFDNDGVAALNDRQYKQNVAIQLGVPLKEGATPIKMPGETTNAEGNKVMEGKLAGILPNARITSEKRTPGENAADTGVSNSQHLKGTAMDFVPKGQHWTPADLRNFAAELDRKGIPHTELAIEQAGDAHSTGYHIHWAWGNKS